MKDKNENWAETLLPVNPEVEIETAREASVSRRAAESLGMSRSSFRHVFEPVARELISNVQMLPASMFTHHTGPGGLSAHSMEVGHLALRAFNNSVSAPNKSESAEKKAAHLAWQAFAFAVGSFHDIRRIGKSFRIFGDCKADNITREFDAKHDAPLYDWIVSYEMSNYKVEISRFLDLSCDTEHATTHAIDMLSRYGFLEHKTVLQAITDERSARRKAISEFVIQGDLQSVTMNRANNPGLKRTPEENAMSLTHYFGSQPSIWNKLTRMQSPKRRTIFLLKGLLEGAPMVDELFELYEMRYLRGSGPLH
jgi:hypothetical protein